MAIGLISDSCCDTSPALKNLLQINKVPFYMTTFEGEEFVDTEDIDIKHLLASMKASKGHTSTACPSPESYAQEMRKFDECFVMPMTSVLSGSYNAACVGRDMVLEEYPDKKIYIFDTLSATAGQTRIAMYIRELIEKKMSFESIIDDVNKFMSDLNLIFVIEDLGNLVKNGRISKAAGIVGSMLSLCPVMEDVKGEIVLVEKVRGTQKALTRLVDITAERTKHLADNSIVMCLSHCNCIDRALAMKKDIMEKCKAVKDVIVTPSGGLSTVYTNNGGVVLAFPT